MKFLIFLLLAWCSLSVLPGAEPYVPPPPKKEPLKLLDEAGAAKALEMLSSPIAKTREKARLALRKRAWNEREEIVAQCVALVTKAREAHKAEVEKVVKKGVPALDAAVTALQAWETKRTQVMALIMTDFHKAPDKVAMLSTEHAAVDALMQAADKELKAVEPAWKPLLAAIRPMEEMDRELSILNDRPASYEEKSAEKYLQEIGAAKELLGKLALVAARQRAVEEHAAAQQHNAKCEGIPPNALAFVTLLNAKRQVMNLQPLRLNKNLCQAATDHSKEMIALGYFSHTSPTKANRSPEQRANNAKFDGSWVGENIFMGSAAADSAYSAWWASDEHRFIMFGKSANTAGVGPVGNHWTLMTGSKNASKSS